MRDPTPLRHTWASAFSTQALADLDTRDLLAETNAEPFARLHFLQMAAEKLCKAYLLNENGFDDLPHSHCLLQKQLPRVIEHVLQRTTNWPAERCRAYLRDLKPLIREMELLSPACDEQGTRPDNCEYPWLDASATIRVPAESSFASVNDRDRKLVELMKLMRRAAHEVDGTPA